MGAACLEETLINNRAWLRLGRGPAGGSAGAQLELAGGSAGGQSGGSAGGSAGAWLSLLKQKALAIFSISFGPGVVLFVVLFVVL